MTQEPHKDSLATRRGVLAGVGLVGLAGAITACGASGSSSSAAVADPATSTRGGGATSRDQRGRLGAGRPSSSGLVGRPAARRPAR